MPLFRKDEPGGAPGHVWHRAGEIVEVLDEALAAELRRIEGFTEVLEPVDETVTVARPADIKTGVKPARRAAPAKKAAGITAG